MGNLPASLVTRESRILISARILSFALMLLAGAAANTSQAAGLWQQNPLYSANTKAINPGADQYTYRMLDTGGTGGMAGKGDIHNGLRSVDFWDDKNGWTAGEGGVFKTDDGGLTWRRSLPAGRIPSYWWRVRMRGPREIWALKRFHGQPRAELYRSLDDGDSWAEVLQGRLRGAADLQVRGSDIFVLCGDSPSYRSSDGGRTWSVEKFGGLLNGAVAISEPGGTDTKQGGRIYVLGQFRRAMRLIRSVDSGRTWKIVSLPADTAAHFSLAVMFFANGDVGAIGLDNGLLLFTTDGGKTWEQSNTPNGKGVTALWMDDSGKGFFATENSNRASPGLALSQADFRRKSYLPARTAAVEFHEIGASPHRIVAVGSVRSGIPNDAVLVIEPK